MILGKHQLNKNPIEPKPASEPTSSPGSLMLVARKDLSLVMWSAIYQYTEKSLHRTFYNKVVVNGPRGQQNVWRWHQNNLVHIDIYI